MLWLPVVALAFQAPGALVTTRSTHRSLYMQEPPVAPEAPDDDAAAAPDVSSSSKQFDLKKATEAQRKDGAGFNQFDPVLLISRFVSRRFGLAGGLAFVVLLAATEGNEILKSVLDTGPEAGSGETITTASGLKYVDVLVAKNGDTPKPGNVIGFNAKVSIGDVVLFDSTVGPDAKRIAFKYGQRPFQNVLCEGVEEGIRGMRPGAKRVLLVPKALAPKGVAVPDGVDLKYEIELIEVLPGYF